ncbi:MAG: FAD-binding oxidoreductase [Anaerolineales bacterium]
MDIPNLRWWGWGTLDQTYSLENRPRLWPTLRQWLALPEDISHTPPVLLDDIDLRPPRLSDADLAALRKVAGEDAVRLDRLSRVEHAFGKSYRDLVRVRAGVVPNPPDAVVYPSDESQVAALLAWAGDRDVAVVPFGGGSSVLGGVEPESGPRPVISLDMARMDRVLSVDHVSWTARIQAGATGPEVEAQLNAQGFTLGHFPQSFEFSTLGGWIATRAAGQASTGYGKIEDMTQAVRMVSPQGILDTRDAPATATGPSLLQLLVGSEGLFGVITEATVRIHPKPQVQDYRGFLFRSLEDGLATLRDLLQGGPRPTVARLSDAAETAGFAMLARKHGGLKGLADVAAEAYLGMRGHSLAGGSCVLILGYDGDVKATQRAWKQAAPVCKAHGGLAVGRSVGESWKRERFAQPYLRDILLGAGVLVDTLETATSWTNLLRLYGAMTEALRSAIRDTDGGPGYVMTHVSHVYEWGASLYSTFLGRQVRGEEEQQWWAIKRATTEAILGAGGTLSHHHGIGRDHASWFEREVGPLGVEAFRAVKRTLDPAGILNPGILLPQGR